MDLSKYFHETNVRIGLKNKTKEEVLKAASKMAAGNLKDSEITEDQIYEGLRKREQDGSTGFGGGIAIPHCAVEGIRDFVVGLIIEPDGVDFNASDKKKVRLFVFIITPAQKKNEHIRILSAVSKIIRVRGYVDRIVNSKTNEIARETFLSLTDFQKDASKSTEYSLFNVFIQSEDRFQDVLELFTELDDCYVSVIEASNAGKYLYAMPLFSNFWNDEQSGFHRVILAAVKKVNSNEVLGKINAMIDENKEDPKLMIALQDLLYLNGFIQL